MYIMHRRQCKLVSSSGLFFGHVLYCVVLLTHNACRVCERGMVGQRLWPGSLRVSWRVQALETCWDSRSSCVYFECTLNVLHLYFICTSVFLNLNQVSKFVRHQDLSLRMCFGCPGCVSWMVVVGSLRSVELGMLCALLETICVPVACCVDLGISGPPGGMSQRWTMRARQARLGWRLGWDLGKYSVFQDLFKFFIVFHVDLFRISESCHICSDLDCWCTMLCTYAEFSLQGQKLIVDPRLDKKVPVVELQGGRTL